MSSAKTNVVALKPKAATDRQISEALEASSRTSAKHESEVRKAYAAYEANGWKPVLIYKGKKRPIGNDWLEKPAHPVEDFNGHANIGIALGDKSGGLADIDIDHPELLEAAHHFLPPTGAKFGRYYGREKQSLAHWLYRAPAEKTYVLKYQGKTICEVRSTGGQTVFPPSFTYDDELRELDLVCWNGGPHADIPPLRDVPEVSFDYLKSCINLLAASVFVAERFQKGGFHNGMFSWAGMLAKAGYSEEDTLKSTIWIAEKSGQENLEDRIQGVRDTYRNVSSGDINSEDKLLGISWFREAIPDEKFVHWLSVLFKIKSRLEDDGRPVVRVIASKETKLFDETLDAMIKTEKFYSMAGQIVVINKELGGVNLTTGEMSVSARMTPLADSVSMQSWLTREIQFVQSTLDKVAMQYVDQVIKAPTAVATELANPSTYRGGMPQITGLSNLPLITRKGRVVDETWGYDAELKTFFASKFQVKKYHPDEALKRLREPFVDFPFTHGLSETEPSCFSGERFGRYHAAAISAILAAIVRPAIEICPAYVITSSQYSDGKSVMSNAIAAALGMEGGSPNSPLTRGGSDEEQEKQISSVLARGKRIVVYDNHDGEFRSAALTETLTSSQPEFRVLGKSEVRSIPNRTMFIINGVNIVLASDLQTRAVVIRLARTSVETQRVFSHVNIVDWCYENSERLISAGISLIEWALTQDDGDWKPTHRFKDWDYLVRRTIMIACGVDISPPVTEDDDRSMDPVEEIKNQFLPWVLSKWESGLRAKGTKRHFFSKDLAYEIVPDSDEEGWVNTLSRRASHPMEQKLGKCLTLISDVPFKSGAFVYVLRRGVRDKRTGYWVEVLGE